MFYGSHCVCSILFVVCTVFYLGALLPHRKQLIQSLGGGGPPVRKDPTRRGKMVDCWEGVAPGLWQECGLNSPVWRSWRVGLCWVRGLSARMEGRAVCAWLRSGGRTRGHPLQRTARWRCCQTPQAPPGPSALPHSPPTVGPSASAPGTPFPPKLFASVTVYIIKGIQSYNACSL